jgi:lipoprotein-anchoring transpeptidase ErfK/SrfK
MFNSRAFGIFASMAFVVGAVALTSSATAAPLPLFPFPMQDSPRAVQPAPSDEGEATFELPARFKRQIVNYSTREAAGTIVIDTPNTYLY